MPHMWRMLVATIAYLKPVRTSRALSFLACRAEGLTRRTHTGVAPGARGGGIRMTGMAGSVTRQRYDELVKLGRGWGRDDE